MPCRHGACENRNRRHRDPEIPPWCEGDGRNRGFAVNQIRHWRFVDELASDRDVMGKFSVNPPNVYGFSHQQHVINCLINQRAALVDGLEGRKSPELISALYESIETGQEVALRFATRLSRLGVVVS
jgi:UDP-N-acetyl-2-amino-2-deoxyglucuronate dehydrogenase